MKYFAEQTMKQKFMDVFFFYMQNKLTWLEKREASQKTWEAPTRGTSGTRFFPTMEWAILDSRWPLIGKCYLLNPETFIVPTLKRDVFVRLSGEENGWCFMPKKIICFLQYRVDSLFKMLLHMMFFINSFIWTWRLMICPTGRYRTDR